MMSKIYQIVLKYKNNSREEVVGSSFDRDEAVKARDHYNEHEDNKNIYYLVQSVPIPRVKGKLIK